MISKQLSGLPMIYKTPSGAWKGHDIADDVDDLNQTLFARFPELARPYASLRDVWQHKEPGPHIVYGDVLTPHIIQLLESRSSDSSLQAIFEYLEELLSQRDQSIKDVVGASVLERLNDKVAWRRRARAFMGPHALQLSKQLQDAWGS